MLETPIDLRGPAPDELSPEGERQLYRIWERCYFDLARATLPLAFVVQHYVKVLEDLCRKPEEARRYFYFYTHSLEYFPKEVRTYYELGAPLVARLGVVWDTLDNDEALSPYFRDSERLGSPLIWNPPVFRPQVNPAVRPLLPAATLALLEEYCRAQEDVIDFMESLPFLENDREFQAEMALGKLVHYMKNREDALRLKANRAGGLMSEFYDDQLEIVMARMQVSLSVIKVFPGDVPVFREALTATLKDIEGCRTYLFEGSRHLARKVARRYARVLRVPSISEEDLFQEGCVGLLKALYRFHYRRGSVFPAYATWWVKQTVKDYLAAFSGSARLPIHQAKLWHRIRRYKNEYMEANHCMPSVARMAAYFKVEPSLIRDLELSASAPSSLDAPVGDEEGTTTLGLVRDDQTQGPRGSAEAGDRRAYVRRLLDRLKPDDRQLLMSYFGFPGVEQLTLRDISNRDSRGVTREAIRLRLKAVMRRLLMLIPEADQPLLADLFGVDGDLAAMKKQQLAGDKSPQKKAPKP